jgi:simple sugar transport system ATP-binding protein
VDSGKSVIFISHKLNEVMELADRIVVLRRGRVVGETTPAETSEEALAAMMVGRAVSLAVEKAPACPGEPVLVVDGLDVLDDRHHLAVKKVSFEVCRGEIVGLAGVQGNGQTELVEALTGMRSSIAGQVRIAGHDVTNASPREIVEHGTAYVPEDRQQDGLVLGFPVADNFILNTYYRPPFARGIRLQREAIDGSARQLVDDFDVRTPGIDTKVANLSGGNQQKVIVAREFNRPIQLLIASQPTRGLDVGSIEYIHSRIGEKRDGGAGVLLISSELDEVMQLADRILVMFRGELMADIPASEASRDQIGLLMAGVRSAHARPQPEEVSG